MIRSRGEGTIRPYGTKGRYEGRASMGVDPATGKSVSRWVTGANRAEVVEKLQQSQRERAKAAGRAVRPSRHRTVEVWVNEWLSQVAVTHDSPATERTYRSLMVNHVLPVIGNTRLDRLTVADVDAMLVGVTSAKGRQTAANVRRTLHVCLQVAVKKGYIPVSPVATSTTIAVDQPRPKGFGSDAARRALAAVRTDRLAARWLIGLTAGIRQAEALGLRWDCVTWLADGRAVIEIRSQLTRSPYRHGCADQDACTDALHTTRCRIDCTSRHAKRCPEAAGGGLIERSPKSASSRRTVPLTLAASAELAAWRRTQQREHLAAGLRPVNGFVFTQPHTGKPIRPEMDWKLWKKLQRVAGIEPVSVHAMRHTMVTAALAAGVSQRVIAEMVGWSGSTTVVMMARYGTVEQTQLMAAADALEQRLGGGFG